MKKGAKKVKKSEGNDKAMKRKRASKENSYKYIQMLQKHWKTVIVIFLVLIFMFGMKVYEELSNK